MGHDRRCWRRTARVAVAATVGLTVTGAGAGAVHPPAARATPSLTYGVLGADPQHLSTDTQAGVRLATVTVGWNMWQPSGPDEVDASWVSYIRQEIRQYEEAGWEVMVDPGLEYPPSWVLDLPNGQLVDQDGHQSGTPNFEWDATVRVDMVSYLRSVVADLAPVNPQSYRIGLSSTGEMLYGPDSATSWWAYGEAQSSTPMPGWVPGQTDWRGEPVTQAQVASWYGWYLSGLVDAEHAELSAFRDSGYVGQLDLPMPGDGTTPSGYSRRLAEDLATDPSVDRFGTMDTGAVWWQQLDLLDSWDAIHGAALDVTSLGDGTGADGCQPGDQASSLAQADPWVSGWSDTRWLTYLARSHGLAVVGENPGGDTGTQMAADVDLARSCGAAQLLWNSDDSLYAGGDNASLADYQHAIEG